MNYLWFFLIVSMNNILIESISSTTTDIPRSSSIQPDPPLNSTSTSSSSFTPSAKPEEPSSTSVATTTTLPSSKLPATSASTEATAAKFQPSEKSQTPTPIKYIQSLGNEETCFREGMPWCESSGYGLKCSCSTLTTGVVALLIAHLIV